MAKNESKIAIVLVSNWGGEQESVEKAEWGESGTSAILLSNSEKIRDALFEIKR